MKKLAFIGAGKMAEALIAKLSSPGKIFAADISRQRLNLLKRKYKIKPAADNQAAVRAAEIIILAVKPQNLAQALQGVKAKGKLVVSIAAGIPLSYLQKKLPGARLVRAMPNNPCMVGAGITALAKGKGVSAAALQEVEKIFKAVGEVVRVPEKYLDAVTGLSGSGPAYVYQVVEGLTIGGALAGLPKKIAQKLAAQTVLGAAATICLTGEDPDDLTAMVASKGGTTVEGLKVLRKRKMSRALVEAVLSATKKSRTLSKKWTL